MTINKNIGCTVSECEYHAKEQDYCCLEHIEIDRESNEVDSPEATECKSFEYDK